MRGTAESVGRRAASKPFVETDMKRCANPLRIGIGGALLACLAMVAGPAPALAQPKPPDQKKDVKPSKQPARPAKNAVKNAGQSKVNARKPQLPPKPRRRVHPTAKPIRRNQIPEPTVQLKPGEVPAIKFDMQTYDFGRIRAGGDVVHDFWFTNTGNGPLELLRVKPG